MSEKAINTIEGLERNARHLDELDERLARFRSRIKATKREAAIKEKAA